MATSALIRVAKRRPSPIVEEIERFLVTYNEPCGKKFAPLKILGPTKAMETIDENLRSK